MKSRKSTAKAIAADIGQSLRFNIPENIPAADRAGVVAAAYVLALSEKPWPAVTRKDLKAINAIAMEMQTLAALLVPVADDDG